MAQSVLNSIPYFLVFVTVSVEIEFVFFMLLMFNLASNECLHDAKLIVFLFYCFLCTTV